MKQYYYQIREQGKLWEDTPARKVRLRDHGQAVWFAYRLAEMFNEEIRWTDNKDLFQGHYARPCEVIDPNIT